MQLASVRVERRDTKDVRREERRKVCTKKGIWKRQKRKEVSQER